MQLSREEQETIILFNEATGTAEIEVYSSRLKRRMEQLLKDRPDEVKITQRTECSVFYEFPKSWVKINPTRNMNISDEQREALRERARANFK